MKNPFSKIAAKTQGVSALEYALIAALIAVGIIAASRAADADVTVDKAGPTLKLAP